MKGLVDVNLRNYPGEYNIGLDMGTGSVGWAVTDEQGALLHFKKKPTWGSRLFDSAQPASEARTHRVSVVAIFAVVGALICYKKSLNQP